MSCKCTAEESGLLVWIPGSGRSEEREHAGTWASGMHGCKTRRVETSGGTGLRDGIMEATWNSFPYPFCVTISCFTSLCCLKLLKWAVELSWSHFHLRITVNCCFLWGDEAGGLLFTILVRSFYFIFIFWRNVTRSSYLTGFICTNSERHRLRYISLKRICVIFFQASGTPLIQKHFNLIYWTEFPWTVQMM